MKNKREIIKQINIQELLRMQIRIALSNEDFEEASRLMELLLKLNRTMN